jgi:hypothetical protein
MKIMTGELIINIIICCSTIIAIIMHGNKFKKVYTGVLPVMLKEMVYQLG